MLVRRASDRRENEAGGLFHHPMLAVVGELQINPKILSFQKGNRRLQIIFTLADHSHLLTLDLRLHLYLGLFHGLGDFLGLLR